MSLYSTDAAKAGTFKLQPWTGTAIYAEIGTYNGKKYIYAEDSSCVPISSEAVYSIAVVTASELIELMKIAPIGLSSSLTKLKVVYDTSTKQKVEIPTWANPPIGFTSQVPREFDEWDGSLWITNMTLRNATLKKRKLIEINNDLETALSALRVEYPESEIMSWTKQENEARAWLRDNTRATPLIDLIASQRGLDKTLLINKVIQKSDQYAFAVGSAIGRRQMLEDQVKLVEVGQESKLDQIKF